MEEEVFSVCEKGGHSCFSSTDAFCNGNGELPTLENEAIYCLSVLSVPDLGM